MKRYNDVVDFDLINNVLHETENNKSTYNINKIIGSVKKGHQLNLREVASLLLCDEDKSFDLIFEAAHSLNQLIHGKTGKKGVITFYGVIYLSDFCLNTCRYCGDNISSLRTDWRRLLQSNSLTEEKLKRSRRLLTKDLFIKDVDSLLTKHPQIKEICILSGDTPSLNVDKIIEYLVLLSERYKEKIILNIPPLDIQDFKKIRKAIPYNVLQFRVFQETYHPEVFNREHPEYDFNKDDIEHIKPFLYKYNKAFPTKRDMWFRIHSQERAILAGFDEVGLGVLFGLNDSKYKSMYEILALYLHSKYLYQRFGLYPYSISFPRILASKGVNYSVPSEVSERELMRLVAITRLAIPSTKLIITCRESAEFRKKIRPIINIEDFEARPGPGGNIDYLGVDYQMEIQDRRTGAEIKKEMIDDGYKVY